MVTKKKDKERNVPTVEADDPSPILAPHLERQPGEIPHFVERKPDHAPVELTRDEKFDKAIEQAVSLQTDEEWKELIRSTPCFAKLWYDRELDEFCDQVDCDLRQLCQATWEKVEGPPEPPEEPPQPHWEPRRKRKVGRPRKGDKVIKRNKWKGTGKYERHPYQDRGRPMDKIALGLFSYLGDPPPLPDGWKYPVSKTLEQRREAISLFVGEFGSGVWVTQRSSYHQYLFEGEHLFRLWVTGGGGGWMDLSKRLAKILSKMANIDLVKSPVSGYKTKFRFYPFRIYVGKDRDVELIKAALAKIENLVG
jgi:hypothetical protein